MSHKINSKNLSYDATPPPFLAALRAGMASDPSARGPDPILAANRRMAKPRSASDEAENAPLVVDADGNVTEAFIVAVDGSIAPVLALVDADADVDADHQDVAPVRAANSLAQGATPDRSATFGKMEGRKRKVVKIVGHSHRDGKWTENGDSTMEANRTTQLHGQLENGDEATKPGPNATLYCSKNKQQRAKRVKLSFADDEG